MYDNLNLIRNMLKQNNKFGSCSLLWKQVKRASPKHVFCVKDHYFKISLGAYTRAGLYEWQLRYLDEDYLCNQ